MSDGIKMRDEILKKKIMRRVYSVWLFRRATNPFALEMLAFAAAFFWLAFYVSFENVAENVFPMMGSPVSFVEFFILAFSATELVSKILLVVAALSAVLMIKDLTPNFLRIFSGLFDRLKQSLQFAFDYF